MLLSVKKPVFLESGAAKTFCLPEIRKRHAVAVLTLEP